MAATAAGSRLTEAHRLAQVEIGKLTVAQLLAIWPLLDLADLDGTFARWLSAVVAIVTNQRRASAQLAGVYISTFRALEVGVDAPPITPTLASAVPLDALQTSMLVTGPVALKRAIAQGIPLQRAADTAKASSASSAMRHTLNGGRDTVTETVKADPVAIGWARVVSGTPCAFCAFLASRGAVYRAEETADFQPHDACACFPEPIFRRDAALPPGAKAYRQLWNDSTKGLHGGPVAGQGGGEAFNAFRRAYEASPN